MKSSKAAAIACLIIGSLGLTAGIVHAQPAVPPSTVDGTDLGLHYAMTLDPDAGTVRATIDEGKFTLSPDTKVVMVTDPSGAVLATLPMAVRAVGQPGKTALIPRVDPSGRTLTLTPLGARPQPLQVRDQARAQYVDAAADLARHQYNAGVGALIGLGVGILIGIWFLVVGAIPGGLIGAGIGALIGYCLP
jgi:hypothetical protein